MSYHKEIFVSKIVTALIFVTLFFPDCKKSNDLPPDIQGNWIWQSTWNDGAPGPLNPLTPFNTGTIQALSFTKTNWSLTKNSQFVSSGTYTTSKAKNTRGESINQIHFFNEKTLNDSITYYQINKDSLVISNGFSGAVGSDVSVYL